MRHVTLALILGLVTSWTACTMEDPSTIEVDEPPDPTIGEETLAVTVQCGGRNYTKITTTCPGTSGGNPLSPYACRAVNVATQGATGLPNAYYVGPCVDGQFTRRTPTYYDQFVTNGPGIQATWNLYLGQAGSGMSLTEVIYVRETPQPDVGQAFAPRDPPPGNKASTIFTTTCGGLEYNYQVSACSGGVCKTDGTPAKTSGGVPYTYYTGTCGGDQLFDRRVPSKQDTWIVSWQPPFSPYLRWNLRTSTAQNVYFRAQPLPWYVAPEPPDDGGDDDSPGDDTSDDGEVCNVFGSPCGNDNDCNQGACAGEGYECYNTNAPGFPADFKCCHNTSGSPFFNCE